MVYKLMSAVGCLPLAEPIDMCGEVGAGLVLVGRDEASRHFADDVFGDGQRR